MMPAARLFDMHVCPMVTPVVPPIPHVGGPILGPGALTVLIGGLPAACIGDICMCVGPPDVIVMAAFTVLVGGRPVARLGDMTAHGGVIMLGCFTVLIGGPGGGGGAGGAGGVAGGSGPNGMPVTTVPSLLGNDDIKVGNSIVIEGTPEFQQKVLDRLNKMASTKSGRDLLERIDKSGKTMTIKEYPGDDNSDCAPDDWQKATAKGKPVYYGDGSPKNTWLGLGPQEIGTGEGSDCTVRLNPDLTLPNSANGPVPNDAILFHEMTHGVHDMEGTTDCAPVSGWDTKEEQSTISSGSPSEADYLKEQGYGYKRTDHDLHYAPNP